jgi:hypothetical protein
MQFCHTPLPPAGFQKIHTTEFDRIPGFVILLAHPEGLIMVAPFQPVPASQIEDDDTPIQWIWPGLLAKGSVTVLTGEWKAGKTTLLSILLSRFGNGGTVAGRPVLPGSALVITEEPRKLWRKRHLRLNLPDSVKFQCRPFKGRRPTIREWDSLIEDIAGADTVPDLVVIDPMAMFLPGHAESYAPYLLDAVAPLQLLTERDSCVMMNHHPCKRSGKDLLGRGNASLHGFVDIDAKLHYDTGGRSHRARRIESKSRPFGFSEVFRIELNEDGLDYSALPDEPDFGSWAEGWSVIQGMLQAAGHPLTAMELWKGWLEDFQRPAIQTLRKWLWMAGTDDLLVRTGSGHRGDPFKYWLKGVEVRTERFDPGSYQEIEESLCAFRKQFGAKGKKDEEEDEE